MERSRDRHGGVIIYEGIFTRILKSCGTSDTLDCIVASGSSDLCWDRLRCKRLRLENILSSVIIHNGSSAYHDYVRDVYGVDDFLLVLEM